MNKREPGFTLYGLAARRKSKKQAQEVRLVVVMPILAPRTFRLRRVLALLASTMSTILLRAGQECNSRIVGASVPVAHVGKAQVQRGSSRASLVCSRLRASRKAMTSGHANRVSAVDGHEVSEAKLHAAADVWPISVQLLGWNHLVLGRA